MEQNDGRVGAAMAAIFGYDGPEVTALGGLADRIEHRRAGLIHKDAVRAAQMGPHVVDHRHQVETGAADPVAEGAAIEVDPLPLEDFGLAIKRKVVAELRDDDPGDEEFGGQSAGHDMLGRMRLRHSLRTTAAGVFRAPRHQHPELGWDHVKPFGHVLADPGHLAATTWTLRAGRHDHPLDLGQMRRQMAAVARGLARQVRPFAPQRRLGLLLCGLEHALGEFGILER